MGLNKDFLIISEAVRTEGYIMKKGKYFQGIAISNKDLNILKQIEKSYLAFFPNRRTVKLLLLIIYLDNRIKVKELINLKNNQPIHFHIDKNKRLIAILNANTFNLSQKYALLTNKGQELIKIYLSEEEIISVNSNLHSTAYMTLQIYNSKLAEYLHEEFKIPAGIGSKKSYIIDFPLPITSLSKEQINTILNIVISCEGCVFHNQKERIIKIKLASKLYLQKLKLMFESIGISCQEIRPTSDNLFVLDIRRINNFKSLHNNISLISKRKNRILKEIISSYSKNRFAHYQAVLNYLSIIKRYGPITSINASRHLMRNPSNINRAFKNLLNLELVERDQKRLTKKGSASWIYKISKKGEEYLKNSLMGEPK